MQEPETTTSTAMEPITAKLRHEEKTAFSAVCESIGTTPSNAIRIFASAFDKRGGFPFDPSNPYEFTPETLAAMDDAAYKRNLSGPFDSLDDMFASLEQNRPMPRLEYTAKFKTEGPRARVRFSGEIRTDA